MKVQETVPRIVAQTKFKLCLCQKKNSQENPRGILCQFMTVLFGLMQAKVQDIESQKRDRLK